MSQMVLKTQLTNYNHITHPSPCGCYKIDVSNCGSDDRPSSLPDQSTAFGTLFVSSVASSQCLLSIFLSIDFTNAELRALTSVCTVTSQTAIVGLLHSSLHSIHHDT